MKNKEMVKCQRIKMAGEMPKNKDGRKVCGACILPASMLEVVFPSSHCFDNLEHKTKQLVAFVDAVQEQVRGSPHYCSIQQNTH